MIENLQTLLRLYLPLQIVLIPIVVIYLVYRRRYNNYKMQWTLHRVILLLTFLLPVFCLLTPNIDISKSKHSSVNTSTIEVDKAIIIPQYSRDNKIKSSQSDYPELMDLGITSRIFIFEKSILICILFGLFLFFLSIIRGQNYLKSLDKSIEVSFTKRVKIISSPQVRAPFSYGLLLPKIFLPAGLDYKQKKIILIHELNHIRYSHLLWQTVELFCKKTFWFNPIYHILFREGEALRELMCDFNSTKQVDAVVYAKELLRIAKLHSGGRSSLCIHIAKSSSLIERIQALMNSKELKPGFFVKVITLSIYISLLAVVFTVPVSLHSKEKTIFSTFLENSKIYGALKASQNYNMKGLINSLTPEELNSIPSINPLGSGNGRLTLGFGYKTSPFNGVRKFHGAWDIADKKGRKVFSTGNGTVVLAKSDPTGYGNIVIIRHDFGFYTLYAHLDSFTVNTNDRVLQGDVIGFVGSTGLSTGPHLHYSIFLGECPPLEFGLAYKNVKVDTSVFLYPYDFILDGKPSYVDSESTDYTAYSTDR